jgi:uncharacterized protein YheU (UPF0270 family)
MDRDPPPNAALPIIVPPSALSEDVLLQLAYERILRERGNDAPADEISDATLQRALRAIKREEILITYDVRSESVGLMERQEFARQRALALQEANNSPDYVRLPDHRGDGEEPR